MENKYSILLKISDRDSYTFFNSMDMEEVFVGGGKNSHVKSKVSGIESKHLRFTFKTCWYVQDISKSKNARLGKRSIHSRPFRLREGDIIYILPEVSTKKTKPILTVEVIKKINNRGKSRLNSISLINKNEHYIGKSPTCDIIAPNLAEDVHCKIVFDGVNCYLEDLNSLMGVYVNNRRIKRAKLENYDRIALGGAAFVFYDYKLLSSKSAQGIEITAVHVEKLVYDRLRRKQIKLVDDISLTIKAGEFVAVVGGSGAGKSTFVDCINGVRPCTHGKVLYDGNNYYENIKSYREVVGIVPQLDIMHDDLSVKRSLYYTAKLRMRRNLKKRELLELVDNVIEDVQLRGKEHLKISTLSGGQKKRVSIAMELLADPKIIFLDEPTSGLSPDLDLEMMMLLKSLASKGRTIVVITHSMENIEQCDRVILLGKGGRLCYYGPPNELLNFFKSKNYSQVFSLTSIEEKSIKYQELFAHKQGVDDLET